jgi:Predicted endonuclease containing a URI domain
MYYVYILQSELDGSRYTGVTQDLKRRVIEHNNGGAKYSKSKRPYRLIWYSAFIAKEKAYAFEKYLKSSSGSAFRNKHLI